MPHNIFSKNSSVISCRDRPRSEGSHEIVPLRTARREVSYKAVIWSQATHRHRNTKPSHEQHFALLGTANAAALYVQLGFSNSIRSQITKCLYFHGPLQPEIFSQRAVNPKTTNQSTNQPLFSVSLLSYKNLLICCSIVSK